LFIDSIESIFQTGFKMMGGPKHIFKLSVTLGTLVIGGNYLMTEQGQKKFINYWYSDDYKPKETIAFMRFGKRADIKGQHDELEALRKINVQPLFHNKTSNSD